MFKGPELDIVSRLTYEYWLILHPVVETLIMQWPQPNRSLEELGWLLNIAADKGGIEAM
jgi:hypothetical protein